MKKDTNLNIEANARLRECRMEAGLTQKDLAKLSNYSVQQICYIEKGKRGMSSEAAGIISKILNVRKEYLLCEDDYKTIEDYTVERFDKCFQFDSAIIEIIERLGYQIGICAVSEQSFESEQSLEIACYTLSDETLADGTKLYDPVFYNTSTKYKISSPEGTETILTKSELDKLINEFVGYINFRLSDLIEPANPKTRPLVPEGYPNIGTIIKIDNNQKYCGIDFYNRYVKKK